MRHGINLRSIHLVALIFILNLVLQGIPLSAQFSAPNPSVPSANLVGAKQHMEVSADLYTGRPNISIPLLNYEFEGLSFPMDLTYVGGNGLKCDELPGWVGAGWSLQAGGFVHRTVRGRPDEVRDYSYMIKDVLGMNPDLLSTQLNSTDYSYFNNTVKLRDVNWYKQSYAHSLSASFPNVPVTQGDITTYNANPTYDLVPDEFTFSVGGISGKFYFNHLNEWVVQSNDGRDYSVNVVTGEQILAQVTDPDLGTIITKAYRVIKYIVLTSIDGIKYYFGSTNLAAYINDQLFEFSHSSVQKPTAFETTYPPQPVEEEEFNVVDIVPHTWHLSKIENQRTGSVITFNYKSSWQYYKTRQAWGFGTTATNPPSNFLIYHNNHTFYRDFFNAESMYKLSAITKVATRTWTLTSINFPDGTTIDFTSTPSTQATAGENFYQNATDNTSFFSHFDMWYMYQNVSTILYKLDAIRIINRGFTKKEVSFDFVNSNSNRLQLNKVRFKSGPSNFIQEYSFQYNNAKALPPYGAGKSDHWGYFNNLDFFASVSDPNSFAALSTYSPYRNPNAVEAAAEILTKVVHPTGGFIELEYQSNNYAKKRDNFTVVSAGGNVDGGGLRIYKIKHYSTDNKKEYETVYEYNVPGTSTSSGVLAIPIPAYLIGTANSYSFQAEGYSPVFYEGAAVTYTNVTERQVGNGKTLYEFTNYDNGFDDVVPIENNNSDPWHKFNYAYDHNAFQRGRPKSIKQVNEAGTPIQETVFQYEHNNTETTKKEVRSLYLSYEAGTSNYYTSVSERIYPDHTISNENNTINPEGSFSKKTEYKYDNYGNIKELITYDSRDKIVKEKYKYAYEYASTGTDGPSLGIKYLNDLGIKNAVIEKHSTLQNADGSNERVMSATINSFKTQSPFLDKTWKLKSFEPVAIGSFTQSVVTGANFQRDTRYPAQYDFQVNSYDSKGNVLESNGLEGISSFLYGDASTILVAKCINARNSDIAFTSFESDGKGNWNYSGIPMQNDIAFTGSKFYNLTTNTVLTKAGLSAANTYILSYWTKNASAFTVAGTVSGYPVPGRTVDGWHYFEHRITGQTTITLSGNGLIDEVRLYPVGAQMETYTYEKFIGLKSQCDANNIVKYYEYDDFGRLTLIRDQDKNIVRKYCYKFDGQAGNCDVFYNNTALTTTVTKAGCPSCTTPSVIFYNVPAGKYLSTVNTAAANAMAQYELDNAAQEFVNLHGSCTPVPPSAINSTNSTGVSVSVTLYNTATFVTYNYTATNGTNSIPPSIPCGIYNISMSPSIPGTYRYDLNGNIQQSGGIVNYSNFQVSGNLSLGITPGS